MSCRKILVVEDEPEVRESLKDLLEMSGFAVHTAANGKEALDGLDRIGEPCLIFLDLMMPVMNGWQFLEAITKERSHMLATIPVVVVSAAADLTDVQQRYGLRTLKKPVTVDALLDLAARHCCSMNDF